MPEVIGTIAVVFLAFVLIHGRLSYKRGCRDGECRAIGALNGEIGDTIRRRLVEG
jgi:hypothetical protein